MTRTLHLTLDPEAVSVAAAIRRMAPIAPLVVVKQAALADLADELGGYGAAATFLLEVAESINTPVAVNVETGPDSSSTVILAPVSWTPERLRGWAAGHHEELERRSDPRASGAWRTCERLGGDPDRSGRRGDRRARARRRRGRDSSGVTHE